MVLPIYILVLLPIIFSVDLTWEEYLRLSIVVLGWFCFQWNKRRRDQSIQTESGYRVESILIALALMFIVTQFDSGLESDESVISQSLFFLIIAFILILIAFGGALFSGVPMWRRLSFYDGVMFISLGCVFIFLIVSPFLFHNNFDWITGTRLILFCLLWFWSTRWLPTQATSEKRLMLGIPLVFLVVCFVGFIRIVSAFYHFQAGESLRQSEVFQEAIHHFDRAVVMGRMLNLTALSDAAVFAKAEAFYSSGDIKRATSTLALTDNFVSTIPADSWEGPAGGMLYTNINCWKDVTLFKGQIRIKIFARGDIALGVWPQMRVMLGKKVLGAVVVDSPDVQPYTFDVSVERARQRLDIAFTNDYFEPPENRNLWIKHAEIHYLEISWK